MRIYFFEERYALTGAFTNDGGIMNMNFAALTIQNDEIVDKTLGDAMGIFDGSRINFCRVFEKVGGLPE